MGKRSKRERYVNCTVYRGGNRSSSHFSDRSSYFSWRTRKRENSRRPWTIKSLPPLSSSLPLLLASLPSSLSPMVQSVSISFNVTLTMPLTDRHTPALSTVYLRLPPRQRANWRCASVKRFKEQSRVSYGRVLNRSWWISAIELVSNLNLVCTKIAPPLFLVNFESNIDLNRRANIIYLVILSICNIASGACDFETEIPSIVRILNLINNCLRYYEAKVFYFISFC